MQVTYLICLHNNSNLFFFFNDTATTEIYTLSLHDALPISSLIEEFQYPKYGPGMMWEVAQEKVEAQGSKVVMETRRSEEHTSELQSRQYLVCRLLLEKKKTRDEAIDTCMNKVATRNCAMLD